RKPAHAAVAETGSANGAHRRRGLDADDRAMRAEKRERGLRRSPSAGTQIEDTLARLEIRFSNERGIGLLIPVMAPAEVLVIAGERRIVPADALFIPRRRCVVHEMPIHSAAQVEPPPGRRGKQDPSAGPCGRGYVPL